MKFKNFVILIITIMLTFACAINAKPKKVEKVVEKTSLELAVEKANEAELDYENADYTSSIEKFNEAIEYYKEALPAATESDSIPQQITKLKLNIAKIHGDYAINLSNQNEYDDAITEFESSLNEYKSVKSDAMPKDSINYKIDILHSNLAITCTKAGEYLDAIKYYDLYLETNPDSANVLLQKFYIYRDNLKDENQAFDVLKEYATTKNDFNATQMLGDLYRKNNDTDNAIVWYEKALAIKNDANILKNLSALYRTKLQWENSTRVLEQYVLMNPDIEGLKTSYKLIGDNYKNLKNKPKAVEYFEKYLELEYNEDITLYVCMYYYDLKNNSKSMALANTILAKNPDNVNAILFRAIAKYNLKDMKGAKADFERIQNDPKQGKTAQQYLKIIK